VLERASLGISLRGERNGGFEERGDLGSHFVVSNAATAGDATVEHIADICVCEAIYELFCGRYPTSISAFNPRVPSSASAFSMMCSFHILW
jgi:hypothetical protein